MIRKIYVSYLLFVVALTSCIRNQETITEKQYEKVILVEYTYHLNEDQSQYNFYLASLHEVNSDFILTSIKRDKRMAPLKSYTDSLLIAKGMIADILKHFPTDKNLIDYSTDKEVILSHGYLHLLLIQRDESNISVINFSLVDTEGKLKQLYLTMKEHQFLEEGEELVKMDTTATKAFLDSIVKKHVFPLHPLPPLPQPPPPLKIISK